MKLRTLTVKLEHGHYFIVSERDWNGGISFISTQLLIISFEAIRAGPYAVEQPTLHRYSLLSVVRTHTRSPEARSHVRLVVDSP